jgi:uncharacterized damage-inducible protein DinB
MSTPKELRDQLLHALKGGHAHEEVLSALSGVPPEARGRRPSGLPHTLWQLLEHLRICQWDILEFARNPKHESPEFPKGYWPETDAPPNDDAWEKSLRAFRKDLEDLLEVVANPAIDLVAPISHLDGVTWLRELMLVVNHNTYHVGQFLDVRRALGCWDVKRKSISGD